MTAAGWEKRLRAEGFTHTYVWQDGPNTSYPEHTHRQTTAHIILEGEMTVESEGETRRLKTGDRFDVQAHTPHSAIMGPNGCKYLIGQK